MSAKVALIGDPTQLLQSVATQLRSAGLEVTSPEEGPVDLLVYVESQSQTSWQALQELWAKASWLPQIYLVKKSHWVYPLVPQTELSWWLHPTQGQKDLGACAHKLIALGKMARQLHLHRPLVQSLDLGQVLDQILLHFGQKMNCFNVHWLQRGREEVLKAADSQELSLLSQSFFQRDGCWRAARDRDVYTTLSSLKTLFQGVADQELKGIRNGLWVENSLIVPVFKRSEGEALGWFIFEEVASTYDRDLILRQILLGLDLYSPYLGFAFEHREAQSRSFIDDLTQLHNHRYLPMVLDQEIARAQRQNQPFSILFMDVDFFKLVNDTQGHWAGSRLLGEIGRSIKLALRSCDYAFRYGGDEFLVVLVNADSAAAECVAERIRGGIEKTRFLIDEKGIQVTMSIGLATFPDHAQSKEQLIKLADEAMYYGKNKSRNIVYVAS